MRELIDNIKEQAESLLNDIENGIAHEYLEDVASELIEIIEHAQDSINDDDITIFFENDDESY